MSAHPTCYLHRHREAEAACARCARPVCERCAGLRGGEVACPPCARIRRTRRRWALVAAAAILLAGAWWLVPERMRPGAVAETPYQRAWREARRRPDDPEAWLRVGDVAFESGALAPADEAFTKALSLSPDDPHVQARMGALRFAQARDATARLHLERARLLGYVGDDADLLLAQLDARAAARREEEAAQRARLAQAAQATELARAEAARAQAAAEAQTALAARAKAAAETETAEAARVAAAAQKERAEVVREAEKARAVAEAAAAEADTRLADARRRAAEVAEAQSAVQLELAQAEVEEAASRQALAEAERAEADARRETARKNTRGREACLVPFRPHPNGTLLLDARMNRQPVVLLFDTGASFTALSREAASRLGVRVYLGRSIEVSTVNGITQMPLAHVDGIVVGRAQIPGATIAICEDCMHGDADGIFGRDLQSLLGLDIDLAGQRAWLPGCD